ncbi:hypothetical protein BDV96DRAFT_639270 [Lophiotrema nucula]|uniref:FAD-binding domain-containing protein n=1 Tax=Lophiotrema nucula TaxID=690887 RepID=A0A6A5ZSL9_9PLEO|nr:hypothetical protein BDV96DRAFT_639270 [Lophiotrema nucula]
MALYPLFPSTSSAVPAGREGYSLSLRSNRPSAGIQTLQKLGLLDQLLEVSITDLGEGNEKTGDKGGFVIWNREWKEVMKVRSKTPNGSPAAGIRINRASLRKTLAGAVEALPDTKDSFGERFLEIVEKTELESVAKLNAQDKISFPHSGHYITSPEYVDLEDKVVFLGDANHAVSPLAGNGADLALMDSWDFAESLVLSGSGGLGEAMEKYDNLAVGRARQVVKISHFSITVMHS